ncbi:cupin domain-containing protein [Puia dinghuensis]|uniref:Cupin n=1 Tax=Puia dinghuensis TaxID=1792502 RepID=A0A8J2U864_9BACT|nr:cupin domain-containing protein [Puia dinghuensis]GGA85054.1 cupin [Puia dinghuensis]
MKKCLIRYGMSLVVVFLLAGAGRLQAQEVSAPGSIPKGDKAPAAYFTGDVWVYPLGIDSAAHWLTAKVTFAPGAHSNWHKHPGAQVLVITDGVGYLKEKGKPVRVLHKGDVVTIPAGVEHWHGAKPDSGLVQIVVNPDISKGVTNWGTRVSDEQYHKP